MSNLIIPQRNNLNLIQVLRGVASLLVVFLHATVNLNDVFHKPFLYNFFNFGGAGVDIFFVLSGFIITHTSFNGLAHKEKLFPFIRRRFVRIFPTYWIIISGFLLLQFLLPAFYKTPFDCNVLNILSTYFLLPGHNMVNGVSWTLSYELFFYILFSLAFIIPSKKITWVVFALYTLAIILIPITGHNIENGNQWLKLLAYPMNVEFFMGVFAALIIPKLSKKLSVPFIIIGAVLFLFCGVLSNNGYGIVSNSFNRVVLFGIPSFFIIVGLVRFELGKTMDIHSILLSLGEASYSLYLLHLPIIVACLKIMEKLNIQNNIVLHLLLFALIIFICLASVLFYKWIEKPLINKLNNWNKKRVSLELNKS